MPLLTEDETLDTLLTDLRPDRRDAVRDVLRYLPRPQPFTLQAFVAELGRRTGCTVTVLHAELDHRVPVASLIEIPRAVYIVIPTRAGDAYGRYLVLHMVAHWLLDHGGCSAGVSGSHDVDLPREVEADAVARVAAVGSLDDETDLPDRHGEYITAVWQLLHAADVPEPDLYGRCLGIRYQQVLLSAFVPPGLAQQAGVFARVAQRALSDDRPVLEAAALLCAMDARNDPAYSIEAGERFCLRPVRASLDLSAEAELRRVGWLAECALTDPLVAQLRVWAALQRGVQQRAMVAMPR